MRHLQIAQRLLPLIRPSVCSFVSTLRLNVLDYTSVCIFESYRMKCVCMSTHENISMPEVFRNCVVEVPSLNLNRSTDYFISASQWIAHLRSLRKSKKVKCTLVQALRLCRGRTAHRGSRGVPLLFLDHGTRRGEGLASRPGSSLPPVKTRYALYRRLVGPQGRSGQVRKISPPPGFDPRTVQSVASRYTDWAIRPTLGP